MKQFGLKFLGLFLILFATPSWAAISPLSVSIVPPAQFPSDDFSITGTRLSVFWGQHRDVYGIDLGLVGNITDQDFTGVGVSGLFNLTHGSTTILGLQFAGITNINTNKTSVYGVQAALVNANLASSMIAGLQVSLLGNYSPHTNIYGAQIGIYNKANEVYGFQIGLINAASNLHGLQIGLINFNQKGLFAVSPLLNIGF